MGEGAAVQHHVNFAAIWWQVSYEMQEKSKQPAAAAQLCAIAGLHRAYIEVKLQKIKEQLAAHVSKEEANNDKEPEDDNEEPEGGQDKITMVAS